jgi:predicted lipid-binding transport protein (Tim44 family)
MLAKPWLKGFLILSALLFLSAWAFNTDVYARAGGGRSFGSRGSRSAAPPRTYTAPRPTQPSQPSPGMTGTTRPATPPPLAAPQPSFWRSFGGGLLGGLAGGMLFRSLFGGPAAYGGAGAGGGGGIGLLDILLLAGIAYLIYWYIKKRRQEAAEAAGYQTSSVATEPYQAPYPPVYDQAPARDTGEEDLERGLQNIRQFDPAFDEARFQDMCMDTFFQIQGAWANREMSGVKNLLTGEMYRIFQEDAKQLKAQKKINRLENIAVRSVDITEAWQESGSDFITVRIYANLLDYNVDEKTGQVIEGSKTEPVKFEEYWTFTRPVGNNPWQLSAIQQAP